MGSCFMSWNGDLYIWNLEGQSFVADKVATAEWKFCWRAESLETFHWSGADHIINWSLYWITNSAHSSWRRKGRYTTMNLLIFYFLFLNYCLSSTYKKCCIHTKSVASTNKFIFIRFFNLFYFLFFLLYKN